jgi:H+/Cl- antiporter ClcA
VTLGVLIEVVAGLGTVLRPYRRGDPPLPAGEGATIIAPIQRGWLLPIVTTLGGLISGLIVFAVAPEAEGHGTDAAIAAFHRFGGRMRSRIPPIKLIASAIRIGSGGSAGREGPTGQIAAGFGSWLGDVLRLEQRPSNRGDGRRNRASIAQHAR